MVMVTEAQEQMTAVAWFKMQFPQFSNCLIHIKNERKTSLFMGALNKKLGVLKGVSDLFLAVPENGYCGLWIEVKSLQGKPTPDQLYFIECMEAVGYYACVCYGADEIINTIKWYLGSQKGISESSKGAEL